MPGMTKKLEKVLHKGEQFITNGQANKEIEEIMKKYGYIDTRWAAGKAALDELKAKVRADEAAFAAQLKATNTFNALFDEVWDQSQSLAQLSVVLFEGQTDKLTLLSLHKRRDATTGESEVAWPSTTRRLSAFTPWARNLYQTAQENAEIAATLAEFGYGPERLAEEAAEIEAMVQADTAQELAKTQSKQATAARDKAADNLLAWLFKAEKVAKLALKGKRDLLGLLGL